MCVVVGVEAALEVWALFGMAADAPDDHATERALVARAQRGDTEALSELLTRHGPTLYRSVLLPRLGSDASARDALSETYEKVLTRIGRFRWQGVGFYPWLRTVALRVALDHLRRRKRTVIWDTDAVTREIDNVSQSTPIDERLSRSRDLEASRERVRAALDRLNPRYRAAIQLRVLEERPRDEVAEAMGVTPATFDVLLHRALKALRRTTQAEPGLGDGPSSTTNPEGGPTPEDDRR